MTKVLVTESSLEDIADAIREKNESQSTYKPARMAAAIRAIPTGIEPTGTVQITQNGTADVTQYAAANVQVPNTYGTGDEGKVVQNGALTAQTSRTVTANGTIDTTTNNEVVVSIPNTYGAGDEGKVVQSGALVAQTSRTVTENGTVDTTTNNEVTVNVQPTLQQKTVTANGVVTPDTGYDGLSQVTVDVTGGNLVKLGSSASGSALLKLTQLGPMGTNYSDFAIPVDQYGNEITIDTSKDFDVNFAFTLATSIPMGSYLNVFGQHTASQSASDRYFPEADFRYVSNSYYSCWVCYVNWDTDSTHSTDRTVLLRNLTNTDFPANTPITVNMKMRWNEPCLVTIWVGGTKWDDSNALNKFTPSVTGNYVPIIGSDDDTGYTSALVAHSGAVLDITKCWLKQDGVLIWGNDGT